MIRNPIADVQPKVNFELGTYYDQEETRIWQQLAEAFAGRSIWHDIRNDARSIAILQ